MAAPASSSAARLWTTLYATMLARILSCALSGIEGQLVQVEVDINRGLPRTTIVGLPDAAVRESKDRLNAALRNAGFTYPQAAVTVNLAPADVRKAGPAYDLPIALGILKASRQLAADLDDTLVIGEVALDGALRPTNGILPVAKTARAQSVKRMLVPLANGPEAALMSGLEIVAAPDLTGLLHHLLGVRQLPPVKAPDMSRSPGHYEMDLSLILGQQHAKRALEIAAAGAHNVLFTGPPGAGKTMLARSLPSILPPLEMSEAIEVTSIYSVAGALPEGVPLLRQRPFRSPHHSISCAGLVGGGTWPRPGEISLAHYGVLFLDELPEFPARTLEALRQPLEDRRIRIARAATRTTFPASFTLLAARNPCPCGYCGDPDRECSCSLAAIHRYERRVSGPLLDRIDMHVEVPRVPEKHLFGARAGEPSAVVRARVLQARSVQQRRFAAEEEQVGPGGGSTPMPLIEFEDASRRTMCNGEMTARQIRRYCQLNRGAAAVLKDSIRHHGLTARAYHRVLKLARTIADMDGSGHVSTGHVAEALQFRSR